MMDKEQSNPKLPKFDKLTDRIINEPTKSPIFVMKTNLDTDDVSVNNPYFSDTDNKKNNPYYKSDEQSKNREELVNFFKQE